MNLILNSVNCLRRHQSPPPSHSLPPPHLHFSITENINPPPSPTPPATLWFRKVGLVAMIAKTDNPRPDVSRPITLLSHLAKPPEMSVKLVMENLGSMLGESQGGFRKERGVNECALILKGTIEICKQQGKPMVAASLDIKKAYDSIPPRVLVAALVAKKLPARLICRRRAG